MRRRLLWVLLAAIMGAGAYATTLLATPSSGFTGTTLAVARFDDIDVKNFTLPANFWRERLTTEGLSDLYVQSNVWVPGGSTGWHTHPGFSLILVTAGTVTAYQSMRPAGHKSADTEALRKLNAKIKSDERVDMVLLPLADGIMMARKR